MRSHWRLSTRCSSARRCRPSSSCSAAASLAAAASSEASAEIIALDKEYTALLSRQFNNNPLLLLGNITKSCNQIIQNCIFGINFQVIDCCQFFGPPEFVLGQMCYRSNSGMLFEVQEAGIFNSIALNIMMIGSGLDGLNTSIINKPALILNGQMSAAVAENKSHTYTVSSK